MRDFQVDYALGDEAILKKCCLVLTAFAAEVSFISTKKTQHPFCVDDHREGNSNCCVEKNPSFPSASNSRSVDKDEKERQHPSTGSTRTQGKTFLDFTQDGMEQTSDFDKKFD